VTERKLLLADDSITIQKVVNLTFADEGIEVLTVGDGDTALQRLVETRPDIVLADVNMPGLNGYQLCERIRADEGTRHLPVVLLVGAFEQFDEAEASRVGATSHLTKPFQSIRQLVNQVTDLISASVESISTQDPEGPFADVEHVDALEQGTQVNPFDEPVRSRLDSFREDRIASIDHTHATLDVPPSELESQGASSEEPGTEEVRPEAEDIDRLYRQSIGEEPLASDADFPDLGVDDEMIETSYSAAHPETDDIDLSLGDPVHPQEHFEDTIAYDPQDQLDTQPLPSHEAETPPQATAPAPAETPATSNKDETVRLDPAMVEAKMAEGNRRFESIEQPTPPTRAPEPHLGEETIRMEERFDTRSTTDFGLEEVDLLDIPSETEVHITMPSDASAKSGKQVVTLSPELIEMIAQRVVEKLSEKY
jgi:CheY-like chemotaxis protein